MKSYDTESRNKESIAETQVEHAADEQEVQSLEAVNMELDVAEQNDEYGVIEEGPKEQVKPGFKPPSREQWLNWLPFWALILVGGILRFWELGMRPLHHDESLHGYFALQLLHNNIENWASCLGGTNPNCYTYDPLLHGPFQFHAIALVYLIAQWLGAPDHGVNTFTVRIVAATLGTLMIGLPYFMRDYLGKLGAWLAAFLLAVAPSMVYFSRFAREDIYMAFFTLLLVVATGRYIRERKMRWLVIGAAAFSLSYATSEATFLTIAVFGSFLGALVCWELGKHWHVREKVGEPLKRYLPQHGGLLLVALYFIIFLPVAKIGLGILDALSAYVTNPKNTPSANLFVENLKNITVDLVPWIGILLGAYILSILVRELRGKIPPQGRRGLAQHVDPERQPLLDSIVTMPWTHWFFAVLAAWTIFLVLFTALFTNIRGGIGDGIWQGLYYWLQQQQVARGGQPWYYYLLLIPLYEQIGVGFGIVGIIRCLLRPNPFRLFLVYWFIGNFVIYSWAGEKMPWLMIFMVMPMCLLAAIGLEPCIITLWNWFKGWQENRRTTSVTPVATAETGVPFLERPVRSARPPVGMGAGMIAVFGIVCAILLLIPTLHNMYEVNFVDPADGPHEMMIYVQTTPDVNIVMDKINQLDRQIDGGRHQIAIGVMSDADWPFAWYLRDYTDVCYGYPTACPGMKNPPVIITGGDNLYTAENQYGKQYLYHQYRMRTWWDEGYKPPPCVPTKANNECAGQPTYGGVGLGLWLSYGDNPPPGAHFNLALAAKNIWDWWWYRKAIGSTDGDYPMGLFIQKGLGVTP